MYLSSLKKYLFCFEDNDLFQNHPHEQWQTKLWHQWFESGDADVSRGLRTSVLVSAFDTLYNRKEF